MAIYLYVDDCKLIHRKYKTNYCMIEWILQEYESIFEDASGKMSVRRGKIHEYLGMTLDYTVCGQVIITMISYIEDILSEIDRADPKGNGTNASAATNDLFVVNKYCKKLKQNKVVEFHNLVAKLYMPPTGKDQIPAHPSYF